jgi:hypothetical protein
MRFRRMEKLPILSIRQNQTAASLLTCRRRSADGPQTLTQTLPQTLAEQEAFLGAF